MMSNSADATSSQRRASYGPTSPKIGIRGAKTRQDILEAGLACFSEFGFHLTAVADLAKTAGISRATMYQYFKSKEEVFLELMTEAGAQLARVVRRLGRLGPTIDGFDNLHWWLGEWSWVFERYAPIFIEWANVNAPNAPIRSTVHGFNEFHTKHLSRAISTAGYTGDDPRTAAILCLALNNRYNYMRCVYKPNMTDNQLLDSLATATQLFLFPDTPRSILESGPRSSLRTPEIHPNSYPIAHLGAMGLLPTKSEQGDPSNFNHLSAAAKITVRRLLDSSAQVFSKNGFAASNIDLIVNEAGTARSTFYRYFDDKNQVLAALSSETAVAMVPLFERYPSVVLNGNEDDLSEWLGNFLSVQRRYTGVLRVWTEGFPTSALLLGPSRDVVDEMGRSIVQTFGPRRSYALHRGAMGMLFASILESFPNEALGSKVEPTDSQIIACQKRFVTHVMLPDSHLWGN
jgi:AcrR family transcriptional regulator